MSRLVVCATVVLIAGTLSLAGGGYLLLSLPRLVEGWDLVDRLREPGTPSVDVAGLKAQTVSIAWTLAIVGAALLAAGAVLLWKHGRGMRVHPRDAA